MMVDAATLSVSSLVAFSVAGVVMYAYSVGVVRRLIGVQAPRPKLCMGKNRDAKNMSRCDGPGDVYGPCSQCKAHRDWTNRARLQWLGPLAVVPYTLRLVYMAGRGPRLLNEEEES